MSCTSKIFLSPKLDPIPIKHSLLIVRYQPLANTGLLSVSMDLWIQVTLYKWSNAICGLLGWASFIESHVFKAHPCRNTCEGFTPFYVVTDIPPCGRTALCLSIHPLVDSWAVSTFWATLNHSAVNMDVRVRVLGFTSFVRTPISFFLHGTQCGFLISEKIKLSLIKWMQGRHQVPVFGVFPSLPTLHPGRHPDMCGEQPLETKWFRKPLWLLGQRTWSHQCLAGQGGNPQFPTCWAVFHGAVFKLLRNSVNINMPFLMWITVIPVKWVRGWKYMEVTWGISPPLFL